MVSNFNFFKNLISFLECDSLYFLNDGIPTSTLRFYDIEYFFTPTTNVQYSHTLVKNACAATLSKIYHNPITHWIQFLKLLEKFMEMLSTVRAFHSIPRSKASFATANLTI